MTERIYVAIYPHYWGRGLSVAAALKEARRQGGSGPHYVVYRMPYGAVDPVVNEMGRMFWTWAEDTTEDERKADVEIVLDKSPKKEATRQTLLDKEAVS